MNAKFHELTWNQWDDFVEQNALPVLARGDEFESDNFYGYTLLENGRVYTFTHYYFGAREFSVYDGNVLTVYYAYQPHVCGDMWKEWHKEVSLKSLELGAMA